MAIYQLDGQGPDLPQDGSYYIADTAVVIGKVRLLKSASVWFGAVLRGDNEWIEVGEGSNIQDNSTCHTDPGFPLLIGHNVILHGCTLEDDSLVGMGSIVMNGARIGRGAVVGAGSVITEGKQFPEYSLIIGSPARVIRTLTPEQATAMGRAAKSYQIRGPQFKKGLKKIG
jgi:carbonic anhydrase/acetyltransferase-like protein (isoleucine patch superfamily)